jgi:hypothetical protein
MNPNNLEDQQLPQNNFLPGNLEFSKTILPGSKLEINQGNEAFSSTIFPGSTSLAINPEVKGGYVINLEDRLRRLRTPGTTPQTSAEPVQSITENLPKSATTVFAPPPDRFQQQPEQTSSDTLFSLPLPKPLGNIAPLEKSITKVDPLFNQPLSISASTTIPNIPQAINPVPNLNQFQTLPPAPAQNIRPAIQNNIVPGPNNIKPIPISKPTGEEQQKEEKTIHDLSRILTSTRNKALLNADKLQKQLPARV